MSEYYRIKQFSELTSTTVKTLRHYDRVGLLKARHTSASGYRLYTNHDLFRMSQIMLLKFLCFPLSDIKKMLLNENIDDLKKVLTLHGQLLETKEATARDTKWLLKQLIESLDHSDDLNWKMLIELMKLLKKDENDISRWQLKFYNESERSEMAQISLSRFYEEWEQYYDRWMDLFREVEKHLNVDPGSEMVQELARKWLALRDEIPASDDLKKKGWEAFQKGIFPKEEFSYDPRVIEFITEAIRIYHQCRKKIREDDLLLDLESV